MFDIDQLLLSFTIHVKCDKRAKTWKGTEKAGE